MLFLRWDPENSLYRFDILTNMVEKECRDIGIINCAYGEEGSRKAEATLIAVRRLGSSRS